ncbi:hypothetical protein [Castellaniella sp. MT123]|uniref:hypothetical protein n=1 Tax=Castellaniella sp. MT123 TaxID=3140381 RepID=UPI0031F34765
MAITSTWPGAWALVGQGNQGGFRRPKSDCACAARAVRPVRRPRRVARIRRIAWRTLWSAATDVLMVLIWAAMIPGFMWLGAAAGF